MNWVKHEDYEEIVRQLREYAARRIAIAERQRDTARRRAYCAWVIAVAAVVTAFFVVGNSLESASAHAASSTAVFGSIGAPPLPPNMKRVTASCYGHGDGLIGNRTASGVRLTSRVIGVAHKTLPLGSRMLIAANGRRVVVTVVDRGPFVRGRDLDLTIGAARRLGYVSCQSWGVRSVLATGIRR